MSTGHIHRNVAPTISLSNGREADRVGPHRASWLWQHCPQRDVSAACECQSPERILHGQRGHGLTADAARCKTVPLPTQKNKHSLMNGESRAASASLAASRGTSRGPRRGWGHFSRRGFRNPAGSVYSAYFGSD
jgi:hypothetical protein